MRWADQSGKPVLPAANAFLAKLSVFDAARVTKVGNPLPRLVITSGCLAAILTHLDASRAELGGLLVGQAYGGLNGKAEPQIVAVNRSVESKAFDSTGVSLRMETAVWDLARPLLGPGAAIVGWYHSHPDLGAFFSDTDRTTQRSFFRQAFSVGIVIDPVRKQLRAYLGPDSTEIPAENVMVCGDDGGLRQELSALRAGATE